MAVGIGKIGVNALGNRAELIDPLDLVVLDHGGAQNLRQLSGRVAPKRVHLEEAVLGCDVALRKEQVILCRGGNMRYAVGVTPNLNRLGEPGDNNGAIKLGQARRGGVVGKKQQPEPAQNEENENGSESEGSPTKPEFERAHSAFPYGRMGECAAPLSPQNTWAVAPGEGNSGLRLQGRVRSGCVRRGNQSGLGLRRDVLLLCCHAMGGALRVKGLPRGLGNAGSVLGKRELVAGVAEVRAAGFCDGFLAGQRPGFGRVRLAVGGLLLMITDAVADDPGRRQDEVAENQRAEDDGEGDQRPAWAHVATVVITGSIVLEAVLDAGGREYLGWSDFEPAIGFAGDGLVHALDDAECGLPRGMAMVELPLSKTSRATAM
jgi:hypothetical protein